VLDPVEAEGIRRAMVAAKEAQLVVFVVDATKPHEARAALHHMLHASSSSSSSSVVTAAGCGVVGVVGAGDEISELHFANDGDGDDVDGREELRPPMLLVLNKCDLAGAATSAAVLFPTSSSSDLSTPPFFLRQLPVSCRTGAGVEGLLSVVEDAVRAIVTGDNFEASDDGGNVDDGSARPNQQRQQHKQLAQPEPALLTRARHRRHAKGCLDALDGFLSGCAAGMAVEVCAEELRIANRELGRVVGAIDVEEVLDVLFRDFCIGK
jgi:tRNA U34 5-carboxymethylaminomethyl modifying GTPase MnmE/TrmE